MSKLEVVYRRFFQFWLFSQTKIISHAQKNIISIDADIAHFLWRRKDSLSSKICSKHQEQQRRSSAARRYRWLACVLSQVVRTSSPGSRPRQFFPFLPTPWTGVLILLRNSCTASAEEFYYSFYFNEGLENKLTRAPLLGLAKSIYYINNQMTMAAIVTYRRAYFDYDQQNLCCCWSFVVYWLTGRIVFTWKSYSY